AAPPTTAGAAVVAPGISSSSTPACKSCARMPHDLPQRRGLRPHLGLVRQGSAGLALYLARSVRLRSPVIGNLAGRRSKENPAAQRRTRGSRASAAAPPRRWIEFG